MRPVKRLLEKRLRTRLFRFQRDGVRFLERCEGRGLICDDMGLGKTLQSIAWLAINRGKRPVVIVCPASVKYNWARELRVHADLPSFVCEGRKPKPKKLVKYPWIIINYDILTYWLKALQGIRPQVLIVDECQYVKTTGAKRTKATRTLARKARHVIGLSGTPIAGKPREFFSILNMVRPDEFPSFWKYAFEYCDPKRNKFSGAWEFEGASNLDGLRKRLRGVMIRRMKRSVLHELPQKTRTVIPVTIDNVKEYRRARYDFLEWLREEKGDEALERASRAEAVVRIGVLKQLAAQGKLRMVLQWVHDFLESSREKLLVFTVHKNILRAIRKEFPNAAVVDGSVSAKQKQRAVDRFQRDPFCRVFLGQIKAGGVGINLTAGSNVLFTEVAWSPGDHDQAEDRALRIGQTKQVNVYYIVGRDTIEERILEVIQGKDEVCSTILDGRNGTMRLLDTLLENL